MNQIKIQTLVFQQLAQKIKYLNIQSKKHPENKKWKEQLELLEEIRYVNVNEVKDVDELIKNRIDGRRNANVETGQVLELQWMWPEYAERFLREIVEHFGKGKTLNMCCGASNIGDVRVDTDPRANRTRIGDLFTIRQQFRPLQFNVGIFDPDFDAYNPNSRLVRKMGKKLGYQKPGQLAFDWQFDAVDTCSTVVIFRRNLIMLNLKNVYEEFFLIRDHRPMSSLLHLAWKSSDKPQRSI